MISYGSPERYPVAFRGILAATGLLATMASATKADEPLIDIPVPRIDFALRNEVFSTGFESPPLDPAPPLPEVQPSLFPDAEPFETFQPAAEHSGAGSRIRQLAIKVAPAVVSIRVWDEFGAELSSGVGVLVTSSGIILTDAEILHPALAPDVAYISILTGSGENFRVDEIIHLDLTTGVALLGIKASNLPFVELDPDFNERENPEVSIVALHPSEGLSLNDATITRGTTPATSGWFELSGSDSPGAIGSPVFGSDGRVVGLVSFHVPLRNWTNFALPVGQAVTLLESGSRRSGQTLEEFSPDRVLARHTGPPLPRGLGYHCRGALQIGRAFLP